LIAISSSEALASECNQAGGPGENPARFLLVLKWGGFMLMTRSALCVAFLALASSVNAEPSSSVQVGGATAIVVPVNTLVVVTPTEEITSKEMRVGQIRNFMVVNDVVEDGAVVIRRGAPVKATVSWRTGKGIVGKSAKFELTFNSVRSGGRDWALRGSVRQEGRGNTTGALLGAAIITGRSAVIAPGQLINVFTAEEIPFQPPRATTFGPSSVQQPAIQPSGINPNSAIKCITCY
jgi:hypothetical protein